MSKKTDQYTKNILLIDDNQSIHNLLNSFLTLKKIDYTSAIDGHNGLNLIKQKKFDVILVDLNMPKFSGYAVLDSLERDQILKNKNIFLFTALPLSKLEEDVLVKRGVRACIRKPIRMNELLQIIGLNDD